MTCPDDSWTASQYGCFRITPENAPHTHCVDLCGPDASLACIGSEEENAFVRDMAVDFVTQAYNGRPVYRGGRIALGTYSTDTVSDSASHFDRCASGESPAFTNWVPGGNPLKMNALDTQGGRCVVMLASTTTVGTYSLSDYNASTIGGWVNSPCTKAYKASNIHCLCKHGQSPTPEYREFLTTQVSTVWTIWVLMFFVVTPILTAVPFLILRAVGFCRRYAKRRRQHRQVHVAAAAKYSSNDADVDTTSVDSVDSKLAAAEIAAASLRNRVSGTMSVLGWGLFVAGFQTFGTRYGWWRLWGIPGDEDITQAATWMPGFTLHFWGVALLLLSIRPTEAIRIRNGLRITLLIGNLVLPWFSGETISLTSGVDGVSSARVFVSLPMIVIMIILTSVMLNRRYTTACCLLYTALLVGNMIAYDIFVFPTLLAGVLPVLCSFKNSLRSTLPPRIQLRCLWYLMRALFFSFGIPIGLFPITSIFEYSPKSVLNDATEMGHIYCMLLNILGGFFFSRRNRGRVHRWLGELGKSNRQQQEAASVAALIGSSGRSASSALALAERPFRALSVAVLTEAELMDNKPAPDLYAKTEAAKIGDVSMFISHSWSDPGAPKYAHVQEWAEAHGGSGCKCWLDKACIDQTNIDTSLACLPIFLASCDSLLVLAGKTYATRLWCVMELFVYLRMGGRTQDVAIRFLGDGTDMPLLLSQFDAGKARCYHDRDRQRLLAVIEAGFGTFDPFNKIVRDMFKSTDVAKPKA